MKVKMNWSIMFWAISLSATVLGTRSDGPDPDTMTQCFWRVKDCLTYQAHPNWQQNCYIRAGKVGSCQKLCSDIEEDALCSKLCGCKFFSVD